MPINKDRLANIHTRMPGNTSGTLSQMGANSARGTAIRIGTMQRRPISVDDRAVAGIELSVEAATIRLYVNTFSQPVTMIRSQALIKEANGTQWIVATANLEMMDTVWVCQCVRNYGEP
jgi:hypothetical protein